jgi:hypothetical protein
MAEWQKPPFGGSPEKTAVGFRPRRTSTQRCHYLHRGRSNGSRVDDRHAFWWRFEVSAIEGQQNPDAGVVSTLGDHRVVGSSAAESFRCAMLQ